MGRPPIGRQAMTATERQRRWRQGKRRLVSAVTPSTQLDDQDTGVAAPARPLPEPVPAPPAAADDTDEALRRERDEAVRERDAAREERNQMRRERDEACEQRDDALRSVMPKPELTDDGRIRVCWCSFCGKRWGHDPRPQWRSQVERMIVGSVRHRTFICNECVARCAEIIAERRAKVC